MSDFLSRIAARAVGAPALAQPRLPVFLPGTAAAGLEVIDDEVVAPATPPRAPAQPSSEPGRAEPRSVREATPLPAAPVEPPRTVPPAPAPPGPAAGITRQERLLPALEPVLAIRPDSESDARSAKPRATVAVTAVPATPTASVIAAPAGAAAPAAVATARDEPPPVRVHIGRLEVHASVGEAPRPQRRPEPREPEALSLSDYLRGRRGA